MPSRGKPDDSILCSTKHPTGLRVIVCSLPRTGTTSIKLALEQLGYCNVYHMSTFVDHTEDYQHWVYAIKAKKAGHVIPCSVWDALLGNYQVVVDAPACYFVKELAKMYPRAKVVILNRDSEQWYTSFAKTVQEVIRNREAAQLPERMLRLWVPTRMSAIIHMGNLLSKSGVGIGSYGREECLEFFHRYYADCRANMPPERCIEFKVQDGWGPLCRHLGVPVPGWHTADGFVEAPFPQVNDTEAFKAWVARIRRSMLRQTGRNMALHALILLVAIALMWQVTAVF
ncbi:P-loop containing nucleoside triphosphate hydrolase protein [Xylaria sp. CBS 124048]|nr:P-loop containing nucleoside triphosphate hydrolase protein [Xylaria sp. CBS 124048]